MKPEICPTLGLGVGADEGDVGGASLHGAPVGVLDLAGGDVDPRDAAGGAGGGGGDEGVHAKSGADVQHLVA